MANYKDKKYRGSSNKMKNDKDLGIDDLKLVSFSSLSTEQVLCYNGTNWVNGTVSGGGATSIDGLSDAVANQGNINFGTNGIGSIYSSYSAANNIGVGNLTLQVMRYGSCNIAIGASTMRNGGTSFGFQGNTAVGDNSAHCLGTGGSAAANNTFVGRIAGCTVTSGCNNLILGANTTPSSATVSDEITLGDSNITSLRIPGLQSGATDGDVLTYCSADGNIVLKAASGGGGSISCFSYDSGSSALVATADLTSTCSALFGDVLISGNTITPDDSNTVTCLGADGTLNISGNLDVQGDFLKLPQATNCSTIAGNTASAGALRYNTTTNTIQVHNGTEFTGVGGGGGASSLNDLSDGFYDDYTYFDEQQSITFYRSSIGIGDNALASYSRSGINDQYNSFQGTNIAVGTNTLQCMVAHANDNCGASHNIAIGTNIACNMVKGQCNVLLGHNVLCCSHPESWICDNVIIGDLASACIAESTLNGGTIDCVQYFRNTVLGVCANYRNYCGIAGTNWMTDNVVIGFKAGWVNCNRGAVIIGTCAGCKTSQVSSNSNNCKESHVHIGWNAGSCSCGKGVITLGAYAGHKLGGSGLHHLSMFIGNQSGNCNTGNLLCNVIIGGESGSYMCNSCYNTIVGTKILDQDFNLNVGSGCFTGNNNTVIGYDAAPSSKTVSNQITLGNTSITSLRANVTSISSLSDQRDKTNICDLSVGLCFVDELKPVTFDWNRRDGTMSDQKDVGFIAQDLDSLQQKYNIEDHLNIVLKSNPDRLEASPGKLIPILVKAIQELTKKVEELENKIGE